VLPTALPWGARTFLDTTRVPRPPDQPLRARHGRGGARKSEMANADMDPVNGRR
jgi:hypothetical protein